jgi:hypothetical protein
MNWASFAFAVSGAMGLIWLVLFIQFRWSLAALVTSIGHFVLAGFNAAAPVRGYIDPNYVGWSFGALHADKGLEVTVQAGGVFLAAFLASMIAIRNPGGPVMWFVSFASAFFLVVFGGPFVSSTLVDVDANTLQFGEYLTVPGKVATPLLIAVFVVPFVIGTAWGADRAMAGDDVDEAQE